MANDPDQTYVLIDQHRPGLELGEYTLKATLDVDAAGAKQEVSTTTFWVGGERFSLAPAAVHSVYPPEESQGRHARSLPHVALRRDTLPWERTPGGAGGPWLALVLLSEAEAARCPAGTITFGEYRGRYPTVPVAEPGQSDDDVLQVIALPREIRERAVPTRSQAALLCHVRAKLVNGTPAESVAMVVSRRLPEEGRNTVHLVSLEHRFQGEVLDAGADTSTVVSLMRWSFTCEPEVAAQVPPALREPLGALLEHLAGASGWLRIPRSGDAAEPYLARGRAPLPHSFRTGESGASWYAGPLVPGPATQDAPELVPLPAKSADALLWYHEQVGMLDVTYAAAWELGRLLALEQRAVETALATWRRQQVLARQWDAERVADRGYLPPLIAERKPVTDPPAVLVDWVKGLWRLEGIPFKYLVPDERMLEVESIRFFSIDRRWMEALLDGALGLARPGAATARSPAEQALLSAASPPGVITGFLLRSAVVSGWPGLLVEAEEAGARPLEPHHRIQFSPSIVMCLFKGEAKTVRIRQHRDTAHLAVPDRAVCAAPGWPSYPSSAALARALRAETQALQIAVNWGA